jgi:hypothetical protein
VPLSLIRQDHIGQRYREFTPRDIVMSFWRIRRDLCATSDTRRLPDFDATSLPEEKPVAMRHSQPIQVDGVFLGVAVEHELGVRFIAIDGQVTDMDQSIWPTLDHAYRSARQLFKSGRTAHPV